MEQLEINSSLMRTKKQRLLTSYDVDITKEYTWTGVMTSELKEALKESGKNLKRFWGIDLQALLNGK